MSTLFLHYIITPIEIHRRSLAGGVEIKYQPQLLRFSSLENLLRTAHSLVVISAAVVNG